jgi:hypothetical protein
MDLLTGTIKLDLVQSQFARGRMAAHIQAHEIADCEHISLVPERVLAFLAQSSQTLAAGHVRPFQ